MYQVRVLLRRVGVNLLNSDLQSLDMLSSFSKILGRSNYSTEEETGRSFWIVFGSYSEEAFDLFLEAVENSGLVYEIL